MKSVLCYGDSNTWGYVPGSGERFASGTRWPGVLQTRLGADWRVIEEGLNGRTTVWDEPFRPGRNGKTMLGPLLESHTPLDLLILFLGTNDLKHYYTSYAADVARGIGALIDVARASTAGTRGGAPELLLVAPPHITTLSAELGLQFRGAEQKSLEFGACYRALAAERGCKLIDAAEHVTPSRADGVHLDAEGHARLAACIADRITGLN